MNKHNTFDPNYYSLCGCELFWLDKVANALVIMSETTRKYGATKGAVKFQILDGVVALTGYDGARAFTHEIHSAVLHTAPDKEDFSFWVDGVDFARVIRKLQTTINGAMVSFSWSNGCLGMSVGRTSYRFVPVSIDDDAKALFDPANNRVLDNVFTIAEKTLWRMLQTAKPFMSRAKSHDIPSGIRFMASGLRLVAISGEDGLIGYDTESLPAGAAGLDLVIPPKSVRALVKALDKKADDPVKVSFNTTHAQFDFNSDSISVATNDPAKKTPDALADFVGDKRVEFARIDCQDLGRVCGRLAVINKNGLIDNLKKPTEKQLRKLGNYRLTTLSFDDNRIILSMQTLQGLATEELGYEPWIDGVACAVGVDPNITPFAIEPTAVVKIAEVDKNYSDLILSELPDSPDLIHLRWLKDTGAGFVVARR